MSIASPQIEKARASNIWKRDELDWYVEGVEATEALLKVERFIGHIWDPCCGQGNIITTCEANGYAFRCEGTDIVRRADRYWFRGERDFLAWEDKPLAQNIVMNPPFFRAKGAEAFIRKALSLATGKVAAFVDIRFLAGADRANGLYFDNPPTRIWIITPRISCPPGDYLAAGNKAGNGSSDWCWAIWDKTAPRPAPGSMCPMGWLRRSKPASSPALVGAESEAS